MANPAHLLSLSRALLAPVAAWALWADVALLSCAVFAWAVLSDLVDGRLARRRGEVSPLGTLLDHGADCLYVTAVMAVAALRDLLPAALPILVATAFVRYVLAARAARGHFPGSRFGRWNGVAYFVIVGATLGVRHLAPGAWAADLLWGAGWLLAGSTLLLIVRRPPRHASAP